MVWPLTPTECPNAGVWMTFASQKDLLPASRAPGSRLQTQVEMDHPAVDVDGAVLKPTSPRSPGRRRSDARPRRADAMVLWAGSSNGNRRSAPR